MIETAPTFHATEEDMLDSFGDFVEAIDARLSGPGICKSARRSWWRARLAAAHGMRLGSLQPVVRQGGCLAGAPPDGGVAAAVVPPKGWTPRKQGYSPDLDLRIPHPIRQLATGSRGLYRLLLVSSKPQSVARVRRPVCPEAERPWAVPSWEHAAAVCAPQRLPCRQPRDAQAHLSRLLCVLVCAQG